jgi:hypothetical protein
VHVDQGTRRVEGRLRPDGDERCTILGEIERDEVCQLGYLWERILRRLDVWADAGVNGKVFLLKLDGRHPMRGAEALLLHNLARLARPAAVGKCHEIKIPLLLLESSLPPALARFFSVVCETHLRRQDIHFRSCCGDSRAWHELTRRHKRNGVGEIGLEEDVHEKHQGGEGGKGEGRERENQARGMRRKSS